MFYIPLTKGYVALVDNDDYEWLNQYSWHVSIGKDGQKYAKTRIWEFGKMVGYRYMHRMIMGDSCQMVDHADGNGLNNTRKNLRQCTNSTNQANRIRRSGSNFSGYRGVYRTRTGKWTSHTRLNGNFVHIGSFLNKEDAAAAYNRTALSLWGEYARLNKV